MRELILRAVRHGSLSTSSSKISVNKRVFFVPSLHRRSRYHRQSYDKDFFKKPMILCFASAFLVGKSDDDKKEKYIGKVSCNLPNFSIKEVERHSSKKDGVWVVYGHGVYDVTSFVENHPGGETILLAAGQSLEPFWSIYAQHHTQQVYDILESYRIGNLDEKSIALLRSKKNSKSEGQLDASDQYANDPDRHPALVVRQQKPFNAETPPMLAVQNHFTPQSLFFVRNHMPVPDLKEESHSLHVVFEQESRESSVDSKVETIPEVASKLSVKNLKDNFEVVKVEAAIQCSGNRRSDFNQFKEVRGLTWDKTAISNGSWTGVRLRDVILKLKGDNLSEDDLKRKYRHVQFEGCDSGPDGKSYGASIPLRIALDPSSDVILAWELNGETLSRDHGYPLRVVVPGVVGARSVKWLKNIRLSEKESQSHWQQKDYKMFNSSVDWNNVKWDSAPAIQESPVQCALCFPGDNSVLTRDSEPTIKGYAFSGGGRSVIRVDISLDDGETWYEADLHENEKLQDIEEGQGSLSSGHDSLSNEQGPFYGWTLWTFTIPKEVMQQLERGAEVEIIARATDSHHNVMPSSAKDVWNIRGVLNNSWHRSKFKIE